jgi:hypothetical protein
MAGFFYWRAAFGRAQSKTYATESKADFHHTGTKIDVLHQEKKPVITRTRARASQSTLMRNPT